MTKHKYQITKFFILTLVILILGLFCYLNFDIYHFSYAQEESQESAVIKEPVTINGDTVEYSTDNKEATAVGNVLITYKGTKLTCEKIKINTETKDAEAIGNVRLEDKKGVIEGDKIIYNFQNKTGVIINSKFRSNPFFGKAEKSDKVSDSEFIAYRGYVTTCSYDRPHYRMKSRKVNFFPGDKVQMRGVVVTAGQKRQIPLLYLPQYNHSLKDPFMHVQLMPGKTKDWGYYMLSAWRYNLTDNVRGRIYFDYRNKLGTSEGFGANYTTEQFGKGDFKYYYTRERSRDFEEGEPAEFQRYLIRWRHKWDIDKQTNAIVEYYKITDSKRTLHGSDYNFLKEYFFREYEKDTQPLSYVQLHRSFNYSGIDFLVQKRVNRWYDQEEKLPEIKYTMPSLQLGESPFYLENTSSYLNFNQKKAVPASAADDADTNRDISYNKYDTTNKLSLPAKIAFINLTPFISGQHTYIDNDKNNYGATSTVVFSTGSDASTKFYRLFNIKSNFLGLDINNLRHIITPSIAYSYSKTSVMPASKARFGGGASTGNSSAALSLSNKLQTKRKGQSIDLVDFNATTTYTIKPKTVNEGKRGSSLSDFVFDLKLRPYSWLGIGADTTYQHTDRYGANYRHFSGINYDVNFNFGGERSFAVGQRYLRKGSNEITYDLKWRLNPKWRFSVYQRRNMGHDPNLKTGLAEQEYSISRDMHCWNLDITYNVKRGHGETIWFILRLKAFPELEFEYNQSYHAPKPGSQANQ